MFLNFEGFCFFSVWTKFIRIFTIDLYWVIDDEE